MSKDQKLSPGSKLGPYKIIRLIAKGGMGEVYEAYEEVLQRPVALKIITETAINGIPEILRLFVTEGKALAQLNHPSVVTIYQLGESHGIYYIAMEYIEGIPLDEHIAKRAPDLKRDLFIFYRILLGVQALHRKGIIHRDLKPKNIMIQGDKGVKIVDFGIAEIVKETRPADQQTTQPMGSVYYMSPEVARGEIATFQSDIWSLGVLLYQLLTRQRPFTGKTQAEVLTKITSDAITFPVVPGFSVPPKYKDMILKMCKRSLNERYQSIDDIIRELGATATTPSSDTRFSEMLIGVTITAAAGLAAWQILRSNRSTQTILQTPEPAIIAEAPVPSTTLPAPVSALETSPPSPPLVQTAPMATTTTTLATTPAPLSEVAKSKAVEEKMPALAMVKLKSSQAKVVLNFKMLGNSREPASLAKSITNPPILSWRPAEQAESYLIQIAADTDFKKPIVSKKVPGSSYKWELPKPGTFYWRVQALSSFRPHGEFSDFGTLQIQLPAPIMTHSSYKFMAKSSDKASKKNIIDWKLVPLATHYQVQVFKKNSPNSILIDEVVLGQQLGLGNLPAGEYQFQVIALDGKREPASMPSASSTIQFQQAARLPAPVLKQPSNDTTVPSQGTMITPIACSWSAVKQVSSYEFQLSSDAGFKQVTHQIITSTNQYVLTLPLPRGKFFWRVRSTAKDGDPSAWSELHRFTID